PMEVVLLSDCVISALDCPIPPSSSLSTTPLVCSPPLFSNIQLSLSFNFTLPESPDSSLSASQLLAFLLLPPRMDQRSFQASSALLRSSLSSSSHVDQ